MAITICERQNRRQDSISNCLGHQSQPKLSVDKSLIMRLDRLSIPSVQLKSSRFSPPPNSNTLNKGS